MDENRLAEIQRYLRENPTLPGGLGTDPSVTSGEQHVHIHYHQAPVNTAPVDQNPGQKVLDKYAPYFVMFLGGIIIVGGVTVVLMFAFAAIATILLTLLGIVAGLILLGIVGAVLLRAQGESVALRNLTKSTRKR